MIKRDSIAQFSASKESACQGFVTKLPTVDTKVSHAVCLVFALTITFKNTQVRSYWFNHL
jgi:hypothetical protein